MPLYRNHVAQELENKKSEFSEKAINQKAVEEFRDAAQNLTSEFSSEEIKEALEDYDLPSALPTEEYSEDGELVVPFEESSDWSSHEAVNNWAITNRSSPRTVDLDWTNGDLPERFEEIPSFNYGADGLAGIFQDALLEYQRAMVETERQNAFFGFWRCIEELTLAGHGEKGEIVDRAMWAYSVSASEAHEIFSKTITEQLYDTRNKWVHEANWWSSLRRQPRRVGVRAGGGLITSEEPGYSLVFASALSRR
jgi:hypothetical protein